MNNIYKNLTTLLTGKNEVNDDWLPREYFFRDERAHPFPSITPSGRLCGLICFC